MTENAAQSTGGRRWNSAFAVVAVAATYSWFLLFAQYGFLHLVRSQVRGEDAVSQVMLLMGVAGIWVSLRTAAWLKRRDPLWMVRLGLGLCVVTGVVTLSARGAPQLMAMAVCVGLSMAVLTVSLATLLPQLGGRHHPALLAGAGTGIAYLVSNLPPLFNGSPVLQVVVISTLALLALAASWLPLRRDGQPGPPSPADTRGWGALAIIASLMALVWFDSAAFYVIQETWALKGQTWGTPVRQLTQGCVHLVAALAGGWVIARGRFRGLLPAVYVIFAVAFGVLLHQAALAPVAGPLYAAGISLYSVALVAWPGLAAEAPGTLSIRWRAGLAYAVAGWLGSAMGIGMAQDLHRVPAAFLVAAGIVVIGAWLVRWSPRSAGTLAALLTVSCCLGTFMPDPKPSLDPAERGREVYISDGCINCHSQYARPGTADELIWGPVRELDRRERPVLIGNRRQGPDLMNVGLRRGWQWQRIHLIDPQALNPGSRMPSYAYLFEDGSTRGDDLVSYLNSLGGGMLQWRMDLVLKWQPPPVPARAGSMGEELFGLYCAACHGTSGKGDGELGRLLAPASRDLTVPHLFYVAEGLPADRRAGEIARIVKFGLAGTNMPGHEYLPDDQVAALAAYVLELRGESRAP